jgi:hypothetical protein
VDFDRDVTTLSLEEKYPELPRLLQLGKERGYVLVDEILEILPEEVAASPEELDEIYLRFSENDIEVIEARRKLPPLKRKPSAPATQKRPPRPCWRRSWSVPTTRCACTSGKWAR